MNVYFHNFDPNSNSGPNKFTRQLASSLIDRKRIQIAKTQEEADVEFALIQLMKYKKNPTILRLDGIYFNTTQDFVNQNKPIEYSYKESDCVVFQSQFNKDLTESWFGVHENSVVIHNQPDVNFINKINADYFDTIVDKSIEVWSCASSWRPHKRLSDNLDYFCQMSPKNSIMFVAGPNPDPLVIKKYSKASNGRVFYLGELDYPRLLSLYKRSSTFVHLAFIDHCPNVVVDAQAAGCKIVCSSSGGTKEIVKNGIVIKDYDWDFSPIDLYSPPKLKFNDYLIISAEKENLNNIETAADSYYDAMMRIKNEKI